MLIGLDASRATSARRTGTERYSLRLIQALVSRDGPHCFRLYFRDPPTLDVPAASARVEHRLIPLPRMWTHVRLSAELLRRPPDALFVPAHVLPLVHPVPSVVTVHDLGYLYYPQAHPPAARAYLDWSTRFSARGATKVIADSEATRGDLMSHYHIPAEKITVVHPGRDESLAPVRDPARLAAVRQQYALPEPYLLHVGTIQPRKNLVRLVEAFGKIVERGAWRVESSVGLVLAGRKGWLYEPIFQRVSELGLARRIRFLDYVDDGDLAALYSGARAFVFPSLYEGFGFPALDAMACGTAVICSNSSSLPEIVGDAALLIDPVDTTLLAAAIEQVLTYPSLRAGLVQRGVAQARKFSWERAARETMNVIDEAASEWGKKYRSEPRGLA